MKFFELKDSYSAGVTDFDGVNVIVIAPYAVHRIWRYAVPCASDYHKVMTTNYNPAAQDYLKGVSPPPDSLCKLETMIDQVTGADKWGEETRLLKPTRH